MPLLPGKSAIGANIRELEKHGTRPRSHKQILAIALHVAGVKPKGTLQKMGGKRSGVEK